MIIKCCQASIINIFKRISIQKYTNTKPSKCEQLFTSFWHEIVTITASFALDFVFHLLSNHTSEWFNNTRGLKKYHPFLLCFAIIFDSYFWIE